MHHMVDGLVSVAVDYATAYLRPSRELQRMKHHPYFATLQSVLREAAFAGREDQGHARCCRGKDAADMSAYSTVLRDSWVWSRRATCARVSNVRGT